jgi:hypothetical protein
VTPRGPEWLDWRSEADFGVGEAGGASDGGSRRPTTVGVGGGQPGTASPYIAVESRRLMRSEVPPGAAPPCQAQRERDHLVDRHVGTHPPGPLCTLQQLRAGRPHGRAGAVQLRVLVGQGPHDRLWQPLIGACTRRQLAEPFQQRR